MNKFFAVYQDGQSIFGVGTSKNEAIEDAKEWIGCEGAASLEDDLVEPYAALVGDMVIAECSEALYREVKESGGDVLFDFDSDNKLVRLSSEIEDASDSD